MDLLILNAAKTQETVKKLIKENNSLRVENGLELRFESSDYDALCDASRLPSAVEAARLRAELDISKTEAANLQCEIESFRQMFGIFEEERTKDNCDAPTAAGCPVPKTTLDAATSTTEEMCATLTTTKDAAVSPIPQTNEVDPFSAQDVNNQNATGDGGSRSGSVISWLRDLDDILDAFRVESPTEINDDERNAAPRSAPQGPPTPTRTPPNGENVVRPTVSYAQTLSTPSYPPALSVSAFVPMPTFPAALIPVARRPLLPPFSLERRRQRRAEERRRAEEEEKRRSANGEKKKNKKRRQTYPCADPRRKRRTQKKAPLSSSSGQPTSQFFHEVVSNPLDSHSMASTPAAVP
jgi:hypothetical protein